MVPRIEWMQYEGLIKLKVPIFTGMPLERLKGYSSSARLVGLRAITSIRTKVEHWTAVCQPQNPQGPAST